MVRMPLRDGFKAGFAVMHCERFEFPLFLKSRDGAIYGCDAKAGQLFYPQFPDFVDSQRALGVFQNSEDALFLPCAAQADHG